MGTSEMSKIPEGTTHWRECEPRNPFRKLSEEGWDAYAEGKWHPVVPICELTYRPIAEHPDYVASTPTWDGQGRPPVGTECEYSINGGPWFRCKINYSYRDDENQFSIISCPHLGYEQQVRHNLPGNCDGVVFRPIRTPEQIEAEERGKAIQQLFEDSGIRARDGGRSIAEALYDKGYRKTCEVCAAKQEAAQ